MNAHKTLQRDRAHVSADGQQPQRIVKYYFPLQRDRAHVSADGGKLTKTKPTIVEVLQRDRAHVSADGT